MQTFLPKLLHGMHPAAYTGYKIFFPNFEHRAVQNTSFIYAPDHAIPANLPIFIANVVGDHMSSVEDTATIIKTLSKTNNPQIHLFTTTRSVWHAQIGLDGFVPEFPLAVNAFLKKYGLPYHAAYAKQWNILKKSNNTTYTLHSRLSV